MAAEFVEYRGRNHDRRQITLRFDAILHRYPFFNVVLLD
jgi:hypothetical protein